MMLLEPQEQEQVTALQITTFRKEWGIIFRVLRSLPLDLDPEQLELEEDLNGGLLALLLTMGLGLGLRDGLGLGVGAELGLELGLELGMMLP